MSDFMMFGMIGLGVVSVLFMSFVYGVYGGTRADLHTAQEGQVYNFVYSQPHKGEPERYIANIIKSLITLVLFVKTTLLLLRYSTILSAIVK